MKTALFAPMYLDGEDKSGSSRLERNIRYIQYYRVCSLDMYAARDFWMADNGSASSERLSQFTYCSPGIRIARFPYIGSSNKPDCYPYCWRALWFVRDLINMGYEKIIFIDTDTFIVSERLAKFTRECNTGWQTVWCKKYNFPESSFQIICKDAFPLFLEFTSVDYMTYNGKKMEEVLPFTHVNKQFDCDRYGEDRIPQTKEMDLYSQAPTDIDLVFNP